MLLRLGGYAIGKHTLSQVYPVDELLPVEQRSRIQLILESMIRAGLLVLNAADEGSGSSAPQMTVEAAHPALIQHWGEVESWRKIDQDALTLRERLREDARSWRRAGQDPSYLSWRGSRLHAIGELVASGRSWLALNEQEEIFYHACRNAQTPEDAARHEELVASQRLAAFARSLTEKAPHLLPHSVLLAAEAVKRTPRPMLECNQALHQATVRLLRPVSRGCLLNWAPVDQLRFSPDGRLLATQSRDATVRVFNVRDGRLLNAFYHADGITAMHFSPSGQHLATSSNDGRVRLFDAKLLKEVRFLQHSLIVTDFAFTVDGHHLVSACLDGIVRQWAVESGQIELELTHEAPVMSVALSTSGRRLATRCGDRKARVFELPGGKKLAELAHEAEIEDLVFSPNGEYLVSTTTEAVGRELDEEDKLPSALRFARKLHEKRHPEPQTSWIIAQETSNPVHFHRVAQLWEVGSLAPPRRLAHSDRIEAVRFSPDSTRVATASRDQTVRLWHIPSGLPLQQLDHDGPVSTVEFSPDGRHLASACMGKRLSDDNDFTVRLWDTKDGTEVARASHESSIFCIAFSTDGRYLATGGADETARLWNPVPHVSANGKDITWCFSSDATYLASWSQQASSFRLQAIRTEREPLSLTIHCKRATFAANGKHLFLLGAVEIHCIRLSNWGQQNLVPLASAQDVYLSEKEDVLYVLVKGETDAGSSLHLWDMDLGKTIAHVELGAEYESLSYIADRETILVTGKSKLAIVSAQSGSVLSQAPSLVDVDNIFSSPRGAHIISLHRQGAVLQRSDDLASVASLCGVTDLTPDRAFLAFVDGTQVEIWDTERGVRVERWPLTGIARRLKLAANGRRVVVYLEDGSLHAFSSETKRQIASVSDDDAVDALAVSNDGCWLAIATSNAHARRNDIHQRRLQLHNLETTQPPRVLYVEQTLAWLGFTADHRHLVGLNDSIYARTSERAYFWEIDTGQLVMELPTWGRNAPGQDEAAISPDLRFVAARVGREVVLYGWQTNDLLAAAKKRLCRNFTEDEWRRYFPEQPYAETFPGLPLPIDSLMEAKKLAQEGDVDGATQRFRNLLSLDANLQFDPDLAARWLAAVPHLTRARAAAGQPEEMPDDPLSNVFARMSEALGGGKPKPQISPSIVEDCLRKARELVPTLDLDDQQVIATVSFSKSLKEGESLAIQGKIAAAAQQFQAAYEVAKSVLSHLGNAKALLAPDFDAERMADLIYYTSQRQEIWLHAIDPNDFERRMETLAAKLLPEITKIAEQRRSFESMLFITQGDEAAKQGDLATATAAFESALRADPSINIGSPSALAQLLVGQTMSATVRNAVRAGNVSQALTVTEELMKLQTPAQIGGDFFNTVAWYGALHGGAAQVLFAADLAIKLSPEEPAYYDTRAVVRLLMQDRTQWPAAITDLQPVVHAAPSLSLRRKRAEWIKSLRAGVDPLTPEILSLLKKES